MTELNQQENRFTPSERIARFLDSLAQPAAAVTDPAKRQQVRFTSTLILTITGLIAVNIPLRLLSGFAQTDLDIFMVYVTASITLFIAYLLSRTAYYGWSPFIAVVVLTSVIYSTFFLATSPSSTSLFHLVTIVLFGSAILSSRDIFLFALGNVVFMLVGVQVLPNMTYQLVGAPMGMLITCITLILVTNQHRARISGVQQQALKTANQQLQELSHSLEERVRERTTDLMLATEVGQVIAQIQDLDDLLQQAVTLIRERFDLYYTQIYLTDETGQWLRLRAGTGTVGKTLLVQGHRLPVDEHSINGRAATHAQAVIVPDTQTSDFFRPNPALPNTRSEMAIPLITGDRVVGVLDVQSSQANSLNEAALPVFQTLTAQLAVAIQNAGLLTEMAETTLFLDSIVANIPLILFVKEAENLRYVRVSKGMEELVGLPASEIEGKNHYDFFPPETATSFADQDYQVLHDKTLVEVPEEVVQGANGEVVLHTLKAPVMGADGEPKYLIGLSTDITERKQIEEQLAERLKQLNLLNEIGRKAEELSAIDEFMTWITRRIPQTMSHPQACVVAVTMGDKIFGERRAIELPRHMVEDLTVRGEFVGRIHIAYLDPALNFRDEDSAVIGSVGRRISSYIENQRLLAQLQTQAENLQKVAEISTAVAANRNPTQLAQEVAELAHAAFDLYQTAVFILEENDLVLTGAAGNLTVAAASQSPRLSQRTLKSLVARAARTGQGILINDVSTEPDFMPHPLLPETKAEIVTPLLVGEQVLGVLDIQSNKSGAFTVEDLNIFTTLASQVAISLQNARQYQQTQTALEELRSLQRIVTGQNWESFRNSRQRVIQGYIANRQELQPIMFSSEMEASDPAVRASLPGLTADEAIVIPVQARGITIGKLGVRKDAGTPVSPETEALLATIAVQVAEALERARLFEETELSRAQTDQLYAGSERVVRATTLDEILEALVASTALQWMDQIEIHFFDQPWRDTRPQTMVTAAMMDMVGIGLVGAVGDVSQIDQFPVADALTKDHPFVVNNVHTDTEMDEAIRTFLIDQLEISSLAVFPLVIGDQWLGLVMARSIAPQDLTEADTRQINSLVDQAAAVAQTIRLIEETQARAQQEQILRRVSERVYTAVDTESVLRTAVQEVGRVLGLEAFVYLEEPATAVPDTGPLTKKATNNLGKVL
ncbi:MAG: GAF domain-containing protein [Ardenticatenaceae bacterium]|nr:GAF domain-containing protein [Ardenticatenaceae bacterium]